MTSYRVYVTKAGGREVRRTYQARSQKEAEYKARRFWKSIVTGTGDNSYKWYVEKEEPKIETVPVEFHCKGMMHCIAQIIKDNSSPDFRQQIDMLLTEYAKFYLYDKAGAEVVTAAGMKLKITIIK